MDATAIRRDELRALLLAVAGHAGSVAVLMVNGTGSPPPLPERMTVSLSHEIAPNSAAPATTRDAAGHGGPELGDSPPPPLPRPLEQPEQKAAKPAPARTIASPAPARTMPEPARPRLGRVGSSVFDQAFNQGIPREKSAMPTVTAPAAITAAARSSLASEVTRRLKREWQGPNGLDVDRLVTTVEWDLNPDGTLAGPPRIVSQSGITDANRSQANRHKEQALKAVRLAAPFALPAQYYTVWRHLRFTFDWKINQ